MNTTDIGVGTVLVPEGPWDSTDRAMRSGIQCFEVNEQGFRFRRMNLHYNGEMFFLSRDALAKSNWAACPIPAQLHFL